MDRTTVGVTLFGLLFIWATAAPTEKKQGVDIYSYHINSTIHSRYAITVITSRVENRLSESKEVHFQVKIPKNAFISKFRITIDGKTYDGVVQDKEEAQQQYSQAVSRGESAEKTSSVGRTLEEFKTSVMVGASSKVTFELTYEELLIRRLGKYQLLINVQPMQPVADLKIDVAIYESSKICFLEATDASDLEFGYGLTTTKSDKVAWVDFYPTRQQQTSCDNICGKNGLNTDLIITYDVERPNSAGEIKASDSFFVHFSAPTDIKRIPINVVFVIDQSGSMSGRKIIQTRWALLKILDDFAVDDHFGLITFNNRVDVWKPELVQATKTNLESARSFVRQILDQGDTDINAAVLRGVEMLNKHSQDRSASILILLTDGMPNTGETDTTRIQANVKEAIGGKFPFYCLGFGFDVKLDFLEKMALENNGFARRIYEGSDAYLQLQGFYKEVATPLLTNVKLNYTGAVNLTQTRFSQYYKGSEIVVAGQLTNTLETETTGTSKSSKVTYKHSTKKSTGVLLQDTYIRRLWGFLTVKQLLMKEKILNGQEKEAARKEAIDLSLKYTFVTPLTSMVVIKPQEQDVQVAQKPKEKERVNGAENHDSSGTSGPTLFVPPPPPPRPAPRLADPFYIGTHVRFLISSTGQQKPLCYDQPAPLNYRLLTDSSSDYFMKGKLLGHGFQETVFDFKANYHLKLSTKNIRYYDGLNDLTFLWEQEPTERHTDSVSLILKDNEMDITMGTIRVVFLRHKKNGEFFLWPDVKLQPNANIQGIFGKANLQYEELPGSVIKIGHEQVKATWSTATDYRRSSAPVLGCWLVPYESVLPGRLSNFILV
ncbi:inter-alpha-trypsin inhibitor heavy chain H3-like [Colossoma macropomum]|uniref:inter-alpha-trypsin inhibitor heavy chain H3-like n=1 Tax=Colossoma macropomum TaxID=42526 RepID=UPI00186475C0|nr:inter-alpha-trypsin inhibitor heavy chain H3-like [Colossoma macropomum]